MPTASSVSALRREPLACFDAIIALIRDIAVSPGVFWFRDDDLTSLRQSHGEVMAMSTLIVEVKIADYAKFSETFPKGASIRGAAGVTNSRVYRGVDDPNSVIVVSDASDEAKARAMLGSPEVRSMMQAGSLQGAPKITFAK
jgi:hypothetical protein